MRPFAAYQRGDIARRLDTCPGDAWDTHDVPRQATGLTRHPVSLTRLGRQTGVAVHHGSDLALLIGFGVVLGVNHELIGSHTQVSARPVNLPTFSDHKQPARLARVGLPGVIERQGLALRQHQRISPAAGKPPKGNSAFCPNRALHDDRRLPQISRLLEPTA